MEAKIKHLEFIQAIITRMSQNSFLVKGWCVTLISAIYALAAKDAARDYVLVTYIVIPSFWVLDGFFIAVERRYRDLYREVATRTEASIDFDLDATRFVVGRGTWPAGIFSKTLLVFYPIMIAVALVVMFLIGDNSKKANKTVVAAAGNVSLSLRSGSSSSAVPHF
jgi:hypothetical protein